MVRILTDCPLVTKIQKGTKGREYTYETYGESEEYKAWVGNDNWDVGTPP
jgi:hypothetical protein